MTVLLLSPHDKTFGNKMPPQPQSQNGTQKKRKKRKKKKKKPPEPVAPVMPVVGFLRRSTSPTTTTTTTTTTTATTALSNKTSSTAALTKHQQPRQSQIMALIKNRTAKPGHTTSPGVRLLARGPGSTTATTSLTSSTLMAPPPPGLPTLSVSEIDQHLSDLRLALEHMRVGSTVAVQTLKEELHKQWSHSDATLRERSSMVVHDRLEKMSKTLKETSVAEMYHPPHNRKKQRAKQPTLPDQKQKRQQRHDTLFQWFDVVLPISLCYVDDLVSAVRDIHLRTMRLATAHALLRRRPLLWSDEVAKGVQGVGTHKDAADRSQALYWSKRRITSCLHLMSWSDETSGHKLDAPLFARLFDGRMAPLATSSATSLVAQLMHHHVASGASAGASAGASFSSSRTTMPVVASRWLLERQAMVECSKYLCRTKFKSHWGNAIKTFEELEKNLGTIVGGSGGNTSSGGTNSGGNSSGGTNNSGVSSGRMTLWLAAMMEKHVNLSVGRGSAATDHVRGATVGASSASGAGPRGPKWVKDDFYFKNRNIFSMWFRRLRPLLIRASTTTAQPVHTLYHGEKYLLALTMKLRTNNMDILKTTKKANYLRQMKAAAAVAAAVVVAHPSKMGGSNGMNKHRGVCFGFRDTGTCKHGDSCKFSHHDHRQSSNHSPNHSPNHSIALGQTLEELNKYERTRENIRVSMVETMATMDTAAGVWAGGRGGGGGSGLLEWAARLERNVLSHTGRTFDLGSGGSGGSGSGSGGSGSGKKKGKNTTTTMAMEKAIRWEAWEGSQQYYTVNRTNVEAPPLPENPAEEMVSQHVPVSHSLISLTPLDFSLLPRPT